MEKKKEVRDIQINEERGIQSIMTDMSKLKFISI